MSDYNRRAIDVRTRLIHASTLGKLGHYDYTEELACGRSVPAHELMTRSPHDEVTCLACIAVMDK